jgi:hypothetical protein
VSKETLTITDNRTGQTYEIPIEQDTIRAIDLRKLGFRGGLWHDELRSGF